MTVRMSSGVFTIQLDAGFVINAEKKK